MRERSRSPVRDERRDYSRESGSRRDYESGRSDRSDRGGRRDRGSRNFSSRRDYSANNFAGTGASGSTADNDELYRAKTERNYNNSIFIGNIPFEATPRDVEDIFEGKFKIVRADIVTNRGRSRGMATVEFDNKDDVREAIAKYDHYVFRGREIFVRQDYPPPDKNKGRREARQERREEKSVSAGGDGVEVFVGNLPFSVNWQALKDLMRKAGEVTRADVRLDSWGKSRGFGTVFFLNEADAQRAVEMFQGYEIEGRRLDARPGRGPGRGDAPKRDTPRVVNKNTPFTEGVTGNGPRSDTIYVSNLPFVTSNDDLYELFETVGRTSNAEIQYNAQGKPTGSAVVQFELVDLSDNAIQNLDNYLYGGRNLKITYAQKPGQEDIEVTQAPPESEVPQEQQEQ